MSTPTIRVTDDGRAVLTFTAGAIIDTRYLTYAQARDLRFALGKIANRHASSASYTCLKSNGDSYQASWHGNREAAKMFVHELGLALETIKAQAAA